MKSEELPLIDYVRNKESKQLRLGPFVRLHFQEYLEKGLKFYRMFFDAFDNLEIGAREKEIHANSDRFRQVMIKFIAKRRQEIS